MVLRPLHEVANPMGRAEIRVVKKLTGRGEDIEPGGRFRRGTQDDEKHDADDDRVSRDFERVFIKGGQGFDAGSAMVDLMQTTPKEIALVPGTVPPIEDKGADKPSEQSLCHDRHDNAYVQ